MMMKSSLGQQLKRFARNKSEAKEKSDHQLMEHVDVLSQVSQDMKNMRNCCDRLLSAAAATVNSAYEFSQSLLEMGSFFMERTTLDDKGECGRALSVLGEVQLELQKLVDHYRAQVSQTITNPSESLLSELRKVEEMKLHCDEKRDIYEHLMKQHREKGKSKSGKGEILTAQQQLQAAREEYDEATRLCIFRAESLKQGLCRSILTQAARHQTAQLIFFDKGLKSLEAVEPYIRSVAQNQHIDCEVGDVEDGDNVGNSFDPRDDQEPSFDNSLSKPEQENASTARNSMEVNVLEHHVDKTMEASGLEGFELEFGKKKNDSFFSRKAQVSSFSAPLYAEKLKEVHSTTPKIVAYALPTPSDAKNSTLKLSPETGTSNSHNLWHSSPLNSEKLQKHVDETSTLRHVSKPRLSSKDTDNKYPSVPLPSPLIGEISPTQIDNPTRQAFSGPLFSKQSPNKHVFSGSGPIGPTEPPRQSHSGMKSRIKIPQHQQHPTISLPQSVSPPLSSSPIISELHELPRPPGVFGHSAPLFNRNREQLSPNKHVLVMSNTGSLLLTPPTLSRSFSNPSRNQGNSAMHTAKLRDSSPVREKKAEGGVPSPPLTPISLSNMAPTTVSSHFPSAIGRFKVVAGKS